MECNLVTNLPKYVEIQEIRKKISEIGNIGNKHYETGAENTGGGFYVRGGIFNNCYNVDDYGTTEGTFADAAGDSLTNESERYGGMKLTYAYGDASGCGYWSLRDMWEGESWKNAGGKGKIDCTGWDDTYRYNWDELEKGWNGLF